MQSIPQLTIFCVFSSSLAAAGLPERAANILHTQCFQCHSGSIAMGGLNLSTREAALKGGTRGPAIVPGNSAQSRIMEAVLRQGKLQMPPAKALPEADIAALREWIDSGAVWPKAAVAEKPSTTHWAFKKPVRPDVPKSGSAWVRNEIDEFVLAKLRHKHLEPSAEASRATLIRRAYFDLTGLPPTPAQVGAFIGDKRPDAYERLVDELLASPRYGEKWGRGWLDLVRYSDTAGFELDPYIPDAWRYRDYVIESFNKDKPYDRFIREQIAGDELFPEDPVAITGTGLYCVGPNRDYYPDQSDINREEILTDYVDTTSAVFLGLTAGCARCHDHKFDPISQKDYYRVQAIFAPAVKTKVALNRLTSLGYDVAENVREIKLREIGEQIRALQTRCRTELFEKKLKSLPEEAQVALRLEDPERTVKQRELATQYSSKARVSGDEVRACLASEESTRMDMIEKQLVSMFADYRSKPFACGITDMWNVSPKTYVASKGGRPEYEVEPGFFSILGGGDVPPPPKKRETTGPIPLNPATFRRTALAGWIATAENPLTARVMVNRIWQGHFGRGIVATASDFGTRGRAPSHPELLDWLATEFVQRGWSIKAMHRLILTSATYRQSSIASNQAVESDPENLFLSHFSRRRLHADEIRDSILHATGALNLKMGGRPVVIPLSKEELYGFTQALDKAWVETADTTEHTRRGIYLLQKRTFRLPLMEVFDAPDSMLTCPRRESSTTAPQSLSLLNGSFVVEQSKRMAERLSKDPGFIGKAWQSILLRRPTPDEHQMASAFLKTQPAAELIRGLLNTNEFLYVD